MHCDGRCHSRRTESLGGGKFIKFHYHCLCCKFCNGRFVVAVSLENVVTDIHELEKGMDLVRKEAELRGTGKERGSGQSVVLRDFLANSEEKLRRLKSDGRAAQDAFQECVEYFGESPRTADANTFFSLLVRFARAFKVSY